MKKLLLPILSIFIFFSIANTSVAKEWYIEQLLDLNYWVEEYELRLSKIEYVYFYNENTNQMYDGYKIADRLLKDEMMNMYRNWEIDYYTMNWIVENYNLFIYHTNKLFNYVSVKEIRSDSKEVDSAILKNYELSRSYYKRVKHLLLSK